MILEQDRIVKVNIAEEMRSSYIDYSMSVIVSRALPDVRDGLKPVHRRILYSMMEQNNTSDKGYRKSARTVGDVMGKYHPHGDSSIYFSLVRMAQDWAMRYPLVDGQGNFGSIDGDSPAAMRYTEARLEKIGEDMMQDLYKDTVDFQPNYDDKDLEPTVLSTRIPNLLVNGATGIAVGMATNMPTHNLCEVIDGCVACIDNPDITVEELMHYIKGPDFPTGAAIYGLSGVREAYETGRGRIVIRAKTEIETTPTHDKIIVNDGDPWDNRCVLTSDESKAHALRIDQNYKWTTESGSRTYDFKAKGWYVINDPVVEKTPGDGCHYYGTKYGYCVFMLYPESGYQIGGFGAMYCPSQGGYMADPWIIRTPHEMSEYLNIPEIPSMIPEGIERQQTTIAGQQATTYDLQGRHVLNASSRSHGLYIQGGKKILGR